MNKVCVTGLAEIAHISDLNSIYVDVLVACPEPEKIDKEKVLNAIPFGKKEIKLINGGITAKCVFIKKANNKADAMFFANAAITVLVDIWNGLLFKIIFLILILC
jgi:uncharacterized protein (TIGR02058 family)